MSFFAKPVPTPGQARGRLFAAHATAFPTRTSAAYGPRLAIEPLRGLLLWLTGFACAFVFIEPSPYEVAAILTILLFVITGLSLRAQLAPLLLILVLINAGYAIAVVQVSDDQKAVNWVLISLFLAVTAIFYAAMLGDNTQRRLELLLRGYLAAALVASLAATAAYFRLLGSASDLFVLYGRARGTFNDPNVLGSFLIMPALLLFRRMVAGDRLLRSGLMLLVLLVGVFLTFSRGAWAQLVVSGMLLMTVAFLASHSAGERLRIVLVAVGGMLAMAALLAALLSMGQVSELFSERAALEQDYDAGHFGRFGRYALGAQIALDHPLGIGPLQFYKIFIEDPHNTFLNDFLSGGWLAGFGYLALSAVTLVAGIRFLRVSTPWQSIYQAVYAAYVGVIAESLIVDIDHWRHYFLILGVLWGLMAATRHAAGVLRSPTQDMGRADLMGRALAWPAGPA